MSCRNWNKRILDSLTPPPSVFVSGARLLNAPTAPPACAHPTAAVQVGGVLIYAMLHSCPAVRRVAAAAAIAVVMVCVGLVVVAAAFPLTCMPSLRKLVAISPSPYIWEGNASHTPTLVRVSVWRSRSAHNHPPLRPPLRPKGGGGRRASCPPRRPKWRRACAARWRRRPNSIGIVWRGARDVLTEN